MTYDNTLKAYEDALAVRRQEAKDMKLMASEVRAARAAEERELARLQQCASDERKVWEEELEVRRTIARKRQEMRKWYDERKQKDQDARADVNGDLSAEQEKELKLSRGTT